MPEQLDPVIFGNLRDALPPSSLLEIYTVFLADTRRRIGLFVEAGVVIPAHMESRARIAHAVRGSAAMVGAVEVAAMAAEVVSDPEKLTEAHAAALLEACDRLESRLRQEGLQL